MAAQPKKKAIKPPKYLRGFSWNPWESGRPSVTNEVADFNEYGRSPFHWMDKSRTLNRAAMALMESFEESGDEEEVLAISLMLGGYSIESLLKAAKVAEHVDRHGWDSVANHAREIHPLTHDLNRLVRELRIQTNISDRSLLDQLKTYIEWAGRYPIPLSPQNYAGPVSLTITPRGVEPINSPVWLGYLALRKKLRQRVMRKIAGTRLNPNYEVVDKE